MSPKRRRENRRSTRTGIRKRTRSIISINTVTRIVVKTKIRRTKVGTMILVLITQRSTRTRFHGSILGIGYSLVQRTFCTFVP